jgi:hypothetical protein
MKSCELYLKLRSVPALVTLSVPIDATQLLLRLVEQGYRAKKVDARTVVVEE